MTCIYHYSIIQSIFTALKILYALPLHPSLPSDPWKPLILLPSPYVCFFQNVIAMESCSMESFQIGFFLFFLIFIFYFIYLFMFVCLFRLQTS